jgi:hypothetical protein
MDHRQFGASMNVGMRIGKAQFRKRGETIPQTD